MINWISVEERLPKDDRDILVYILKGGLFIREVFAANYINYIKNMEGFYNHNGRKIEYVTHWAEFNKPYNNK